jgi:hypothetical protein
LSYPKGRCVETARRNYEEGCNSVG